MHSIERDKILNKQNIEVAYDLNIHNVFTGHFRVREWHLGDRNHLRSYSTSIYIEFWINSIRLPNWWKFAYNIWRAIVLYLESKITDKFQQKIEAWNFVNSRAIHPIAYYDTRNVWLQNCLSKTNCESR